MLIAFTTKLKKKQQHESYIQSIIYNLRARYWNMGSGNERGLGNKLGARRAEQFPHLCKLYFNPRAELMYI